MCRHPLLACVQTGACQLLLIWKEETCSVKYMCHHQSFPPSPQILSFGCATHLNQVSPFSLDELRPSNCTGADFRGLRGTAGVALPWVNANTVLCPLFYSLDKGLLVRLPLEGGRAPEKTSCSSLHQMTFDSHLVKPYRQNRVRSKQGWQRGLQGNPCCKGWFWWLSRWHGFFWVRIEPVFSHDVSAPELGMCFRLTACYSCQ